MAISIGCGSWSDSAYAGLLYPRGTKTEKLGHYAGHFDYIEVNSGYHAMPRADQVKKWVEQTPKGFTFDFKLHRGLSQKPAEFEDLVALTLQRLDPLFWAKKFGTFLLMLSPSFHPERNGLEELDGIIAALKPHLVSVELRNRAWVTGKTRKETLGYYRAKKISWVSVDMPAVDKPGVMPAVDEVTSPELAYLRLHGRNGEGYLHGKTAAERHDYLYTAADLEEIAERVRGLASKAKDVRVVANNHFKDYAPRTAFALRRIFGQPVRIEEQGTLLE